MSHGKSWCDSLSNEWATIATFSSGSSSYKSGSLAARFGGLFKVLAKEGDGKIVMRNMKKKTSIGVRQQGFAI